MNSVNGLTIEMLNLSEDSRKLYNELQIPLDEVVLQVRRGEMLYYANSANHSLRYQFSSCLSKKKAMEQLCSEIYSELERLDMIRNFDSTRFQLSANILALRHMVAEKARRAPSFYYSSCKYMHRLVGRLNNASYEKWQGYDDNTIEAVKDLLKKNLSDTEYRVICMRFGLSDGICRDWEEIAKEFGWISKGGPTYHEKSAICKLHSVIDEFKTLTKIS